MLRVRAYIQSLHLTVGYCWRSRQPGVVSGVGWGFPSGGPPMSLHPQQSIPPVPEDTARVARAAFRRGNPYLLLRDQLGRCLMTPTSPTSTRSWPAGLRALAPGPGHAVAVPRGLERSPGGRGGPGTDRLEVSARSRPDDPGFDYSVLCEFRSGCWARGRLNACCRACWTRRARVACLRRAGGSAPTAHTCSPPCAT